MKNLFLVTSALWSNEGVISPEKRFSQTIDSLKNLRRKIPEDIVILTDGSPHTISKEKIDAVSKYVNAVVTWNNDSDIMKFASVGRKSEAEVVMLFKLLNMLRQNEQLRKFLPDVKRIFKYSARTFLLDKFTLDSYEDLEGKYVFKKPYPSWLSPELQKETTDSLYITRFYSFCISLVENYLKTLPNILDAIIQHNIDTEHAHHLCINKSKVVEFENLYCEGIMSGTAQREVY